MVDAVVSFAVNKLGDALIGETFFLLDVRSQVEELRDELRRMQCFLKDADEEKQQGDYRIRNWVAEIRNLAYDAEDVIDTFILNVDSTRKLKGIKSILNKKPFKFKNLVHFQTAGNDILAIQARLKAISDSTIIYGIRELRGIDASVTNQRIIQHPLRNRYPHVEDNDVIGFENYTDTLLSEFLRKCERRCIVSIVGVGGLGKTTLAKKIYRHKIIKDCFDCCGWSSISQQLNVKDVLGEILNCMSVPSAGMNEGDLMKKLHNYLQDKRYFVVLDDVWKVNHWDSLSPAFPNGKSGSKVLFTTRNKEVALHADPDSLHFEPHFLNNEESWKLLCKKAFRNTNGNCYPTGLETLGREMVRKCGGLPLAICVLGGLLATKRSEMKEWEFVHRDVIAHINRGEDGGVNGILALSYNDLPSHLKPCFLYLGLFPEDCDIPRDKLIHLWIAEGFIPHTQENSQVTLENIGKHQYLAKLIQRCMVQDKLKICRVHDLMRDLCLSKGKEINFLDIYNNQRYQSGNAISHSLSTNTYGRLRRYAINLNRDDYSRYDDFYFNNSDCALRTLLAILPRGQTQAPLNFKNFKLLRVLDIENMNLFNETMTTEVSKLIHLRYLRIRYVSDISSPIGNLRNLQFLEIGTKGLIPETVTKLVQLRHLILLPFDPDIAQNFQIENLVHLLSIVNIQAGKWIRKGCLNKLTNLRKLDVRGTSESQTKIILEEISGKQRSFSSSSENLITSLGIKTENGFPNSIFKLLSCCRNLCTLRLNGRLDVVDCRNYPPNLTKLYLGETLFVEDPMATLQYLPKLRVLTLHSCQFEGGKMVCSSEGFPQLQHLTLEDLENLEEWTVEQGGMPHLKVLYTTSCRKLSMLPEGLRFITTLVELKIERMPLVRERVVLGGEDWYKVRHIQTVIFPER